MDLQEGFEGDEVAILVNGREAARRDGVRTLTMIGLAESVELAVEASLVEVEVRLPRRGLSARATVDTARHPYLGCSVKGGTLELESRSDPFGYL